MAALFGLSIGQGVPLMSLLLDRRGIGPATIGLNTAAAFVGVLCGPLLTPLWVRRFGFRRFLLGSLVGDIVLFLLMRVFDSLSAWFVLRAGLGLIGSGLFTASEAWINLLTPASGRGRVMGAYGAALSGGFALGPFVLIATGIEGWAPFLANAAIVAIAALPLLVASDDAAPVARPADNPLRFLIRAQPMVAIVALFGMWEATTQALLPVWGVRTGMTVAEASALVAVLYLGAVVLLVPIGALADHMGRVVAMGVCCVGGLIGPLVLAASSLPLAAVYSVAFVWGGLAAGIYPIALGMTGARFTGADMVAANAALIMGYGLGALIGPELGGAAMDAWNPTGLLMLLAVLFIGLFVVIRPARFRTEA